MTVGPVDPIAIALPSRYRVERRIGSGGMATVHLATDTVTGRPVAVKVLRHDLAGAVTVERFLLEIRVTQELTHPHIIPLLDAGAVGGLPYLVMPFIDGETLQARLRRERQFPLEEAVRITGALAGALTLAHARGFLHRDVKPANVLLEGMGIYLTDFGIARAIQRSVTDQLTMSGISIGTAGYMSPEQATGDPTLDGRADQYALACVAYEMLAGEPPFTGPTGREVIAKQLSIPAPSVRVIRPALPEDVDRVLRRALEKTPADRYPTVQAFAEALEEAARQPAGTSAPSWGATRVPTPGTGTAVPVAAIGRGTRILAAVAALAIIGVSTRAVVKAIGDGLPTLVPADSVRYAVMPLQARGATLPTFATRAVRSALARWSDIAVVDEAQVDEVLAEAGAATPAPSQLARAARDLRAGRYVRGEIHPTATGSELRLLLVDAIRGDSVLREVSGVLTAGSGPIDAEIVRVVDALLLGPDVDRGAGNGTRSLAARRAFAAGAVALRRFALFTAESAFVAATTADDRYAAAHLGLALTRLWRGDEVARWRINIEQATLGAETLSAREQAIAGAVAAQADDSLAVACARWRALTRSDARDPLAPMGHAQCLTDDAIVVPDRASPSGWRFRTSYREALGEYERAFQLEPRILEAFGGETMEPLQRLFHTAGNRLRQGRAEAPSPLRFTANMAWIGDTLSFVPYLKRAESSHIVRDMRAWEEARRRQRALVRDIAASWVAAFPRSAAAHHALASSLASLGDPSALDTLMRARALAQTVDERLRVASAELSMRLAFAIRDLDTLGLRRVRRLADSLMRDAPSDRPRGVVLRASIAALTGRVREAAELADAAATSDAMMIPAALRDGAPRLMVLSALGAPAAEIAALEDRVADRIARTVPPEQQEGRRLEVLARAASMAFPEVRSARLDSLAAGDELVAIQAAWARGDRATARAGLETIGTHRAGVNPEVRSLDALAPEASLWLALDEPDEVRRWLDPTLRALPQVDPGPLRSPLHAASLVRALVTRARAEERQGDPEVASRLRTIVRILWTDADAALHTRLP